MYRNGISSDKNQQGFTLAELLVSLAIGALLLSLGVPSYSQFTQDARQVSSANELLMGLHVARDLAVTRNERVTVCASLSGTRCDTMDWSGGWIVFVDEDGNRTVNDGEAVVLAGEELDAIEVATNRIAGFLMFRPNGRIMLESTRQNFGEFVLCDRRGATHARVIGIDMSGRPQVSRHRTDGSLPSCPAMAS